ncbi:coat protein [ssRNA phage Gerhypos.2_18]|uniref:Coat protein n=2 Tax=Norzivirales TaxID=2842247 RepID=A0A8S5KZD1_9VIRU|nr:coat protein [ssRNA phage Gerhypos.2_18]QDH89024.1 MAG: hypothetical protein H2Bulk35251_000003 [Leviviridae sp.]DAD50437.1 TPA_asm: coat protein [ssRNA phage Gerhypos.2_18]
MTISLSNITGSAQTGLTTPGYTVVADVPPPGTKGKQYAVSALTGTQVGVEASLVGNPFTLTYIGPTNPKGPPAVSQTTGQPTSTPRNTHKWIVRKGMEVVSGYFATANFTLQMDIPAGAELKDPESIRAALSALIGALSQISSGMGDTLVSGVM